MVDVRHVQNEIAHGMLSFFFHFSNGLCNFHSCLCRPDGERPEWNGTQ